MANKVLLKKSSVAGKIPTTTDLDIGEIAINLTDKKIYSKDSNNLIIELGGSGSGDSLPSQTGNSGKYLYTNGITASWQTVSGGGGVATESISSFLLMGA